MADDDLETRVRLLCDREEIRALKHRYMRLVDLKEWDEFAETLEADAVASYGQNLDFDGRDAIVEFMRTSVGPEIVTVHHVGQSEIAVDGDSATATWAMRDEVLIPAARLRITGASFYDDTYRRGADRVWRIAKTAFTPIYEAVESLDVRTDFKLTSNRWAPDA